MGSFEIELASLEEREEWVVKLMGRLRFPPSNAADWRKFRLLLKQLASPAILTGYYFYTSILWKQLPPSPVKGKSPFP